jgi:hypothetical protein
VVEPQILDKTDCLNEREGGASLRV